ncbi:MAG: hypothetical protein IPP14_07360 [Planctomycetes bacterium]|nr:hypothetical protein [Planctomycetota bacterium]
MSPGEAEPASSDGVARFSGPTPPPEVDRTVLDAARRKASESAGQKAPRLSEKVEKSYIGRSGKPDQGREQPMSEELIVFPCPACGTKYSVGPHHAGKKTTCKKCGAPVTVPTPQVANPTIVGGTRTIRRADIEALVNAGDDDSDVRSAPAQPAPEVDMKGGASVLRKDETLYGQQAPQETGTRVPQTRRGPTTGPRPATQNHAPAHGRAAGPAGPYGVPAKKKPPVPLIAGIGGGVVVLILIVVLIAANSGGSNPANPGGNSSTASGGGTGGTGGSKKSEEELLLADLRTNLNNAAGFPDSEKLEAFYKQAKERKDKPDFKKVMDGFAAEIAKKVSNEGGERIAKVALMLDSDGYPTAKALLRKASEVLEPGRTVKFRTPDGRDSSKFQKNELFLEVVKRLGWQSYTRPVEFDSYATLGIENVREYEDAYASVPQRCRDVELFPQEEIDKLKTLETKVREAGAALEAAQLKDGFAKNARAEFLRFKVANDSKAKVDRKKGKRSFSPTAMRREGEAFDDIWTYTYWKPFIVYVEKPAGVTELDDAFKETLESKSALLQHLYEFFRTNLIDKFNLQRQKPQYNAEIAEKEGWPLGIVVLKDRMTFEQFLEDEIGQPMPGARAYYSPLSERVMTYDDREDSKPETAWFNESVLIHETFHMLSDFYAAGPMFNMEDLQKRPRYSSILVQEGLTDSVSGFTRGGGQGREATYEFLQLNHLRLRDLQGINTNIMKGKYLYRIRDMIECRNYGQVQQKAWDRWQELKMPRANPNWVAQSLGMGCYYAGTCQASYFFNNYMENGKYPYKEKWWEWIAKDYKGELLLKSHGDDSAIAAFKKHFGISSDADWDALDKKYETYTNNLKPEDVGKSGGPEVKPEEEGSRRPFYGSDKEAGSGLPWRREDDDSDEVADRKAA